LAAALYQSPELYRFVSRRLDDRSIAAQLERDELRLEPLPGGDL
jgi:hypothetical protein